MIAHVCTSNGWRPATRAEVRRADHVEIWLLDDGDEEPVFLTRLSTTDTLDRARHLAYACGLPVGLVIPSTR